MQEYIITAGSTYAYNYRLDGQVKKNIVVVSYLEKINKKMPLSRIKAVPLLSKQRRYRNG